MKKILIGLLLLASLSVVGCTADIETEWKEEKPQFTEEKKEVAEPKREDNVLIDKKEVKMTLIEKGINKDGKPFVKVLVENKLEKSVNVTLYNLRNDYISLHNEIKGEIEPNSAKELEVIVDYKGMTELKKFEGNIIMYDKSNNERLFRTTFTVK